MHLANKSIFQSIQIITIQFLLWGSFFSLFSCRIFDRDLASSLTQTDRYPGPIEPFGREGLYVHAFDANPREVRIGDPVDITWFAPLAEQVEIVGVEAGLPPSGTRTIWLDQTKTYQLIARRKIGGREIQTSRFLTIFAEKVIGPPTIWSFRLDRNGLPPNELTNLRWRVRGCSWVRITATNGFSAEKECITDEDILPINASETTTYTLELLNSNRNMITLVQTTLDIVKEPLTPVITRFETQDPSRTLVEAGSPITIFWSTADASEVRLTPDPSFTGSVPDLSRLPPSGQLIAQPLQDTTYTLTAINGNKTTTRQLRIRVTPSANITRFDAQPQRIAYDGQTVVNWVAANCVQAELIGPNFSENVPCSGSKNIRLKATSAFKLKALNSAGGFVTREFIVTVDPPQPLLPEIDFFTTSASRIPLGESVTLSWSTRNAQKVEIIGLPQPTVAQQGSLLVQPTQTTTLTLVVYGEGQIQPVKTWPLKLEVYHPNLTINDFHSDKKLVPIGGFANLSWKVTSCLEIKIFSLSVSSKKPIFNAPHSCSGTYKAPVKRGTTFRLVAIGHENQTAFADVVVGAGQDEVDGWFNMIMQVPEDE